VSLLFFSLFEPLCVVVVASSNPFGTIVFELLWWLRVTSFFVFLKCPNILPVPDTLNRHLLHGLAELFKGRGDLARARVYYRRALAVDSSFVPSLHAWGRLEAKLGEVFVTAVLHEK